MWKLTTTMGLLFNFVYLYFNWIQFSGNQLTETLENYRNYLHSFPFGEFGDLCENCFRFKDQQCECVDGIFNEF